MSTVAYKDGIIAGDTKLTDGNLKLHAQKIYRVHDKLLVGLAGDWLGCLKFLNWIQQNNHYPEITVGWNFEEKDTLKFEALVADKDSIAVYDHCMIKMYIDETFWAAGSGRDIAIGAMAHGATAEEAVEIATEYDTYTEGEVMTLEL